MYRTTAYVGHFLARFERDIKLYMACAALIGFSAFGIYSCCSQARVCRLPPRVGLPALAIDDVGGGRLALSMGYTQLFLLGVVITCISVVPFRVLAAQRVRGASA